MLVTEFGIVVFLHPAIKVLDAVFIMALQLLRESYLVLPDATEMLVKPVQPANAAKSMLVTEFGMVTLVRLEQYANASCPMLVTEFGMVTLVRF